MKRQAIILVFICTLLSGVCFASDHKGDSLREKAFAEKDPSKRTKLFNVMGSYYIDQGQFDTARKYLDKAIALALDKKDSVNLPRIYVNKGNSFMFQGNYPRALDEYFKSIEIREARKDSLGLPNSYNSAGIVYFRLHDTKKALEYWNKCVCYNKLQKRKDRLMDNYSNLAMIYDEQGDKEKALDLMTQSLAIAEEIKDQGKTAIISGNLGQLYITKKDFTKALLFLQKSWDAGGNNANGGIGSPELLGTMGSVFLELKKTDKALDYYNRAIKSAQELKNIDILRELYLGISLVFKAQGNMEKAFSFHTLYSKFTDSIFNKQNLGQIADLKASYEVEKKEKEIKLLEKEAALKRESELHHQKIIERVMLIGFIMLALLAFIIYRGYRIKKKANDIILVQNEEIADKNAILVLVNKELTDSINYAKRIQEAILPPKEVIAAFLPKSFVFFQPRSVVSGDFYFLDQVNDGEIILAACDCTGHGVPGAFMSMIGTEQLWKIIYEQGIFTPALILDALHQGIRMALQQDVNDTRDGMDACLCKINLKTMKMEYAGANRPLWILRKGEDHITEFKPNKQAVGGLDGMLRLPFTNQQIDLHTGDRIYLTTDGYADQFGGERGKKLMVKKFQSSILALQNASMGEQEEALKRKFLEWKGVAEQVDDILVIGFEV